MRRQDITGAVRALETTARETLVTLPSEDRGVYLELLSVALKTLARRLRSLRGELTAAGEAAERAMTVDECHMLIELWSGREEEEETEWAR